MASSHRMLKMSPSLPMASLAASPRRERLALESGPHPATAGQTPKPGAKLTVQVLRTTEGLEASAVQAILTTGLAGWREQYEKKLQQGARLPRELNVSFKLNTAGKIFEDPAIEDSLNDQELRQALLEALKGLQFASPNQKSAVVTIKLVITKQ
jgi:hypothetical protein